MQYSETQLPVMGSYLCQHCLILCQKAAFVFLFSTLVLLKSEKLSLYLENSEEPHSEFYHHI